MQIVLGFLSGLLGLLAGWFGLAMLVIALVGADREGGVAMGAFFNIGPIGAVIGFALGVWAFVRFGLVAPAAAAPEPSILPPSTPEPSMPAPSMPAPSMEPPSADAPAPRKTGISRPFAVAVVAIACGLAWWGWYELIRSPYLTLGYMNLELQFRLPAGMAAPPEDKDVRILLDESGHFWPGNLKASGWRAHQGDRAVILAGVTMSYKAWRRSVTLSMPGAPDQSWSIDLPSDPDPTPDYTDWRPSSRAPNAIELSYRLTSDR
jgi:hypothetical protein